MIGIYGAKKYHHSGFSQVPLFIDGAVIAADSGICDDAKYFNNCFVFPGFADVHVHLREPGFSFKETIRTGTLAAAHGGYTAVCSMPNLSPAPDCLGSLNIQRETIERDAAVRVFPYGTITKGEKGGELSDMEALAPYVIAFSDDGKGVQNDEMMRAAMLRAKALGKMIVAHCEDESLLRGGCIHDGDYARAHGIPGICSESEWRQVQRDLNLVRETGCSYHVCHISTKESVELLRRAKAEGLDVSCETAPHYLLMNDSMLRDEGRFKMNPPLRSEADQQALLVGIADGTIDMIATDHAPHTAEEKSRGLHGSLMGISGLETAFPVLYTGLVKTGQLSLEKLIELMCVNPRRRFGLPGGLEVGDEADFCVVDLDEKFVIDSSDFLSMGKATPFDGMEVYGKVKYTAVKGEAVWQEK